MFKLKKPELLVPAASFEVLKTAIRYGADAVYIGGEVFGLRAKAKNFTFDEMAEGVNYAHAAGKKVYVAANILAHNEDIRNAYGYFEEIKKIKPDALIISDPGIYDIAVEVCPEIDRHISTQANNTNYKTAAFWYRQKAKRIVAARELSLFELAELRENIPDEMQVEAFIHGSMCISYSGRCLLSNYLTGRGANSGECTHPCRWKYFLMEEQRPGEYFPLYENDRGTYIFNSKDLCMIEHIPELLCAGIDSFKIEGRMKNSLYVATVSRTYKKAIEDYFEDPERYAGNMRWYKEQIGNCTYRGFTTGFFFGRPSEKDQIYENSTYRKDAVYLGTAQKEDERGYCVFNQKNKFSVGDTIQIMKPDGRDMEAEVQEIRNDEGLAQRSAPHAGQRLHVKFSKEPEEGDILRTVAFDP